MEKAASMRLKEYGFNTLVDCRALSLSRNASMVVIGVAIVLYFAKIKLHYRRKVLKQLSILLNGNKNAVGNA